MPEIHEQSANKKLKVEKSDSTHNLLSCDKRVKNSDSKQNICANNANQNQANSPVILEAKQSPQPIPCSPKRNIQSVDKYRVNLLNINLSIEINKKSTKIFNKNINYLSFPAFVVQTLVI